MFSVQTNYNCNYRYQCMDPLHFDADSDQGGWFNQVHQGRGCMASMSPAKWPIEPPDMLVIRKKVASN